MKPFEHDRPFWVRKKPTTKGAHPADACLLKRRFQTEAAVNLVATKHNQGYYFCSYCLGYHCTTSHKKKKT